jgi:hypothetical protein
MGRMMGYLYTSRVRGIVVSPATDGRWVALTNTRCQIQRVTKELLSAQTDWLNELSGGSYRVGYDGGRSRLQTQGGAENISQCGTKREISMILDAMIKLLSLQTLRNENWPRQEAR